jgi:hypothetical protein
MEQQKKGNGNFLFYFFMMGIIAIVVVISGKHTDSGSSNEYVEPYHTRSGKFVKGHVRKSVSTSPNAVKKQNYSKGYYQRHKSRYTKSTKD